jgi:hypothetical protein
MLSGLSFVRHDICSLSEPQIALVAAELRMPFLADFLASISRLQAFLPGSNVRTYLHDLLLNRSFRIISPCSGHPLDSGSSMVLWFKTVVFSFPEEPTILLAIGDLGLGFPICSALIVDRGLLLTLTENDWGFSEKHLPELTGLIHSTSWRPDRASGPINLVMGEPNFAHHAWNQLSVLEDLIREDMPRDMRILVTHEPLGPVQEIFPELSSWPILKVQGDELKSSNAPGALFVPVGGQRISTRLTTRLMGFFEGRASPKCQAIRAALSLTSGPVFWVSIRTNNRTLTNQHEMLVALSREFLQAAPNGAIIIDGFSLPDDLDSYTPYYKEHAQTALSADLAAADAICRALDYTEKIYVAAGLKVADSILLGRRASIYFCHHGTVQHKVGWFSQVPGMVHTNQALLKRGPAEWVAAQSEMAVPPKYISCEIVSDADMSVGANHELGSLLNQGNYTIIDVPAAIDEFFEYASNVNVVHRAGAGNLHSTRSGISP